MKECASEITGHVLLAPDLEGHWCHHDPPTEIRLPQQLPGAGIERVEVAFAATGEQQVGGGGQHAAVSHVELRDLPLRFAGLWIHGDDGAVANFIGPVVDRDHGGRCQWSALRAPASPP